MDMFRSQSSLGNCSSKDSLFHVTISRSCFADRHYLYLQELLILSSTYLIRMIMYPPSPPLSWPFLLSTLSTFSSVDDAAASPEDRDLKKGGGADKAKSGAPAA